MKKVLGYFLISLPFFGVGVMSIYLIGAFATLGIFAFAAVMFGVVFLGSKLVADAR